MMYYTVYSYIHLSHHLFRSYGTSFKPRSLLGKSLAIFHRDSETLAAAFRNFSVKWGGNGLNTI